MINFIRLREALGSPRASTITSAIQNRKHMQNKDSILKFASAGIQGLNEVVGVWGGKKCKKSSKSSKSSKKCKSSKKSSKGTKCRSSRKSRSSCRRNRGRRSYCW